MIRIKSIFDAPWGYFINNINKVYGMIFCTFRKIGIIPYNQLGLLLPFDLSHTFQLIETSY
jgi:hypothetical protein